MSGCNNEEVSELGDCTFNGELVQGAEYVNGQYTYRYKEEFAPGLRGHQSIEEDGWGVYLTDKDSTEPITTPLCSTINDKPVVSMSYMFLNSKAKNVDLSSFDTSNVTNMQSMFHNSKFENLDLRYI